MDIHTIRSAATLRAALDFVERHLRFGSQRGRAFYAERFHDRPDLLLVAEEGGEVLGVLLGSEQGDAVLIGELVVAPEWRGQGVGSGLLRAIEQQACAIGVPRIRAGAAEGAEGFYLRNGYQPTLFLTLIGEDAAPELERLLHRVLPNRQVVVQQGSGHSRAFLPLDGLDDALRHRLAAELPGRIFAGYLFNKAL